MALLTLSCFDQLQIALDGEPVTDFQTDKVRALLIYLALEAKPHTRTDLAQFLWPGYSTDSANNSLRQTLHRLRQLLKKSNSHQPWLLSTRQTIQLNPEATVTVDVATFRELIAQCTSHDHTELAGCAACLSRLQQAVALYRGDFLTDFTIDDSHYFEEWRRITQELLHLQALDALTQLSLAAEATGDDNAALFTAQRQLTLEPWRESAHRHIMRILARRGQTAAAIAQYELCRQVLNSKLGSEPTAETTALYEQIRSEDELSAVRAMSSNPIPPAQAVFVQTEAENGGTVGQLGGGSDRESVGLPPLYDWREMPTVPFFTGRTAEVAELTAWLVPEVQSPSVRLISILGLGGMGKTTLAAHVVKRLAPSFTVVLWRSLLNAPPLEEVLGDWLQLLARHHLTKIPQSLDEQLRLLFAHLRQVRCLLILDNVESLFAGAELPGRVGTMRAGYEGYDQLLQRLATSEHRSTVLLTSREQPAVLNRLGRQAQSERGRVRVLELSGLDQQAGLALLQLNGLTAAAAAAAALVESYSGNPLALQITAATIADFFAGDVAAFQQEEGGVFDGMRLVLDQQFARLSALEREILIWLTIEREAITVPMLRSNLCQPVSTHQLLEALKALQNRSLLTKHDDGLTLQNVIIEYTTDYLVEQVYQEFIESKRKMGLAHPTITSSGHPIALSFLNRFALLKAQSKEYVRQSQERLIVQPLIERLVATLGRAEVAVLIADLLDCLRMAPAKTDYAAGNLLDLVLALQVEDGSSFDFSHLDLRQAFLQGKTIHNLNLRGAGLANVVFTERFGLINSVAINPAQTLIAAGTGAGEIRIWHYANRQLVATIPGKQKPVWSAIFSPDGRRLASSDDQTVQLWEIRVDGELVEASGYRTLRGHTNDVHTLAFSADGKRLAGGSHDQTICVWDVESGRLLQRLQGHSSYIFSIAFSPDGRLLASGSDDETVRLWDLESQQCQVLRGHTGRVYGVAFQPQGKLLATGSTDHTVRLWDVTRGALWQTLQGHTDIVRTVAFHPTGAWLASGGYDDTIRLWSLKDDGETGARGAIHQILHGHTAWIRSVAFSPDGKRLISGSIDYTVRVWGWQEGKGHAHHVLQGYTNLIRAVAFSPDGTMLVSGSNDHALRIWETEQWGAARVRQTLHGHTGMIRTIAFHPRGQIIASGGYDKRICLWAKVAGMWQLQQTLTGHTDLVRSITFSPDGDSLVSTSSDQTIRLWDVHTGRQLHMIDQQNGTVWCVAFHPGGQMFATGSADHTICLWSFAKSAQAPHLYTSWHAHESEIKTIAFSPDGQTLASSGDDQSIHLWEFDLPDREPRLARIFSGHTNTVWTLAFSPDGHTLASGGADKTIRLWNRRNAGGDDGAWHTLEGHTNWVWTVAFSPDGQRLISCSDDETIRLWDLSRADTIKGIVQRIAGPYTGMQIRGATGISDAQRAALHELGAVA